MCETRIKEVFLIFQQLQMYAVDSAYPMQLSGSLWQSVLHPKRSHDNQPIGGVSARPLSRQWAARITSPTNSNEWHQLPDAIAIMYLQSD